MQYILEFVEQILKKVKFVYLKSSLQFANFTP